MKVRISLTECAFRGPSPMETLISATPSSVRRPQSGSSPVAAANAEQPCLTVSSFSPAGDLMNGKMGSEWNGTSLRGNPCGIEGFGYEMLEYSHPKMLDIWHALDESVDEHKHASCSYVPVFTQKVASGSAIRVGVNLSKLMENAMNDMLQIHSDPGICLANLMKTYQGKPP
jgi:hypothetical protein